MNLVNIRDVLTSFSPALDYLALSTGDGRIKVHFSFLYLWLFAS